MKRFSRTVLLALLFCGIPAGAEAQKIDQNSNGMSDVWELIYGATGANANADADGDRVSNLLESIAGTNPFDSNSTPKIPQLAVTASNVTVTLPSALGKNYQLQSVEMLCGPAGSNWVTEASMLVRTGAVVTLNAPRNLPAKFFRIVISDVDTDGDGVNDWEEYQLGLDPFNGASNGQLDANGHVMGDKAYVLSRLAAQNVITIQANPAFAVQPDAGQSAQSVGMYTVTRGGFPLNSITVNLGLGGPGAGFAVEGIDHAVIPRPITFPAGVTSQTIPVTPLADTNLMSPVVALLKEAAGAGYSIGLASNASVVIYPSPTPKGTGLTGQYFTNSSTTYSSTKNFNTTNLFLTRTDPVIDFNWTNGTSPNLSNGLYTVRWTGQVQAEFSENYVFDVRTDDGAKLWVNDQLIVDAWQSQTVTDWTNTIALQGGVRYNLRLEYLQTGGKGEAHLSWYSPSQPKEIVPANRLYPGLAAAAPTAMTSPLMAVAFLGQPFSFNVTAANSPTGYTATGLPPGLAFNSATGVIGGTPTLAGDFSVTLVASNSVGTGASIVDIQVIDTGSSVSREIWTGVAGTNISDIPIDTPATITNALGALEGITDYGDNYGERIRGYLTAPVTGNYFFWIAGSDAAELWISNDSEPVNKLRRAWTSGGTGPRQWNVQPAQQSPWLALVAGQRYYIEILHKAGAGTNDNWSVGWRQDSTGTNTVATGVVPAYLLSRYFPLPPALIPGTLYSANMLAQIGAMSTASGSATLRVNADGTQAILKYSNTQLSSAMTARHIHSDPYLNKPSTIMFDIDTGVVQPDGSFVWNIVPAGSLSVADIREIIREGKAYINVHTVNFPGGEINGHFTAVQGAQTFTPPPPAPAWTDDHSSSNAAARFLVQATFGPGMNDIATVQSLGYSNWIAGQFTIAPTHHLPNVLAHPGADPTKPYPGTLTFNTWWQQSVTAPDQLRQRVAFALSEILVVSQTGVLQDNAPALSSYYDVLLDNAFGNFRDLLKAVTLTPAMGNYLDMRGNDKGDITLGTHADENYAREIMQLFSIGLNRMWPNGTLVENSDGNLVPTYDQNVILGMAAVFTGWNYYQTNQANGRLPTKWTPGSNYTNAMVLVPTHHDTSTKRLLDNVMLHGAQGSEADPNNVEFDNYGGRELDAAIDNIFNNPNVGPYVCRQLIQRLVTSHPSPDYLYRVVQKFNDNGAGVRGDLRAVVEAILLDYEARSSTFLSVPTFGKEREPLLRVTAAARAFPAPPTVGGTYSQSGARAIAVTTTNGAPHRLNTGDTVFLSFNDGSNQPAPPAQGYSVTVTSPTTFTVNAPGLTAATYGQSGTVISVTNNNHGLNVGDMLYLLFTTGGASNGVYTVDSVPTNSVFTVAATDSAVRAGSCLYPRLTGGGFVVQNRTNCTVATTLMHSLNPGDLVYIDFNSANSPPDGEYQVVAVPDPTHFTVTVPTSNNQTQNAQATTPLQLPVMTRSGTLTVQWNTWTMNATDAGASSSLLQTPLNSPTVFNFFFPNYQFPGILTSAGLTTPEFQLTSDSGVALQMNFLEGGILNNTANTNGLSSFAGGNGSLVLDIAPWMTPAWTSNAGVPGLVDALNSLMCGGNLSAGAKTTIVNYVANTTNFPYGSPPSATQMRDRVRAVTHLILSSPDYTIQK
jgi:uncharacterized protein (DUF1800 family)